mgnify:CR=1 FL=1
MKSLKTKLVKNVLDSSMEDFVNKSATLYDILDTIESSFAKYLAFNIKTSIDHSNNKTGDGIKKYTLCVEFLDDSGEEITCRFELRILLKKLN